MKGNIVTDHLPAIVLMALTLAVVVGIIVYTQTTHKENDTKIQCNINFKTYCVERYQLNQGGSWSGTGSQDCVKVEDECDRCKALLRDIVKC